MLCCVVLGGESSVEDEEDVNDFEGIAGSTQVLQGESIASNGRMMCKQKYVQRVSFSLSHTHPNPQAAGRHYPSAGIPGEADPSADPVGVPQDARGDDVTERLQHVLQLLLIHGYRQVGDVQVGGVLLLLLWRESAIQILQNGIVSTVNTA